MSLVTLFFLLMGGISKSSASPANRTYLFLSGSPQSGTSLLHNFMDATPGVKSMHAGCNVLYGAQACSKWNHEGQWMLPRNELVSKWFRPGRMCRIADSPPQALDLRALKDNVVGTWQQIWGNDSKVLVEKSPQSMLKIDLYAELFKEELAAGHKLKFLIILKHPATLNTAIMQERELVMKYLDFNWITYVSNSQPPPAPSTSKLRKAPKLKRVKYSDDMHITNLWHFVHTMTRGETENGTSGADCQVDLGWLAATRALVQELQHFETNRENISPHLHIGFMRFEDFLRPVQACYALYKFLYFDNPDHYQAAMRSTVAAPGGLDDLLKEYNDAAETVCGRLKENLSPFDLGKGGSGRGRGTLHRRRLRLRNGSGAGTHPSPGGNTQAPLAFDLRVVQHSLRSRLLEFSQLSSKLFYLPALRRLYATDSAYGTKTGRGYTSAEEEGQALENVLASISDQLEVLAYYTLQGPHFTRPPENTLRSYALMNTFGNTSKVKLGA